MKELCIKLVIETSLHYEARSEKHQITHRIYVLSSFLGCATIIPLYRINWLVFVNRDGV